MDQLNEFFQNDNKVKNHWKLFLQIYVFMSAKYVHDNIISLFMSYFPKFEKFRKNEHESKLKMLCNFFIDYLLTMPLLFLGFILYGFGIYILVFIVTFLVYILPFFNKTRNIIKFGENPRRGVVRVTAMKFKFTFLDDLISLIFFVVCFAILFCDTTLFDDVLSKTSKGGIGTMDLGAGFILFTSGITSRQVRGIMLFYHSSGFHPEAKV